MRRETRPAPAPGTTLPWALGLASAVLLLLATVGWSWWSALVGRLLAGFP